MTLTLHISHTVVMLLPIIAVFAVFSIVSVLKYGEMSSGGGDAGMIGAMMCLFMPIVATALFAVPYGAAILMGMIF